ncbi:hypothetical protein HQ584_07925 [Patescibacteria group bacterium]|nr:hypothetical protein [Patescibacteria group bacterium]
MTPEEQFNSEVWEVLQEIKLSKLRAKEGILLVRYQKNSANKHEKAILGKLWMQEL